MTAALFDPWRVVGVAEWACSCGSTRSMPAISRWQPGDTLWYLEHKAHGASADGDAPGTMPEIPGQLDMFGGAA